MMCFQGLAAKRVFFQNDSLTLLIFIVIFQQFLTELPTVSQTLFKKLWEVNHEQGRRGNKTGLVIERGRRQLTCVRAEFRHWQMQRGNWKRVIENHGGGDRGQTI